MRRKFIIKQIKQQFECQRCNRCCEQPGFVYLTPIDLERLAAFYGLEVSSFKDEFCRKEENEWVLDQPEDEPCRFLTEKGCEIHEAKPQQCSEFPMEWRDSGAFQYCEGIKKIASRCSKEGKG